MTQKDFFAMLGAPLVNPRWSWGAVRKSDGAVILRVWEDNVQTRNGREFVRVARERPPSHPLSHGARERLKHLELIRAGTPCYLIMCQAVDLAARPRRVKRFNARELFPGAAVQRLGDIWLVERRPGLPVARFTRSKKTRRR